MSEPRMEQAPGGNQVQPAANFEVPEAIDMATLAELQGQAPETPQTPTQETVDPEANLGAEDSQPGDSPNNGQWMPNPEQLMGLVNKMVDAKMSGQQPDEEVDTDIVDQIVADGIDQDGARFMVDNVRRILSNEVGGRLDKMEKNLEELGRFAAQNQQERAINTYESHVNQLLDNAQVTDPVEREMYKETITARGMRKHGREFNNDKATQEFRKLRNDHIRQSHEASQGRVEQAQNALDNTPPVVTSQSGGSVAPSTAQELKARLDNPSDKGMDFRGGDFQNLVGAFARGLMGGAPK